MEIKKITKQLKFKFILGYSGSGSGKNNPAQ